MSLEQICGKCNSDDLVFDEETGETICLECGLVVARDNRVRKDYSESIEPAEKTKTSRQMERLMTIDKRIRVDEEDIYVLRQATIEIKRLTQALYLPEIIQQTAEEIYRRAQKRDLILRGTIMGFAAASIYAACRMRGIPRTLRGVAETSTEDTKSIARMYRIIVTELGVSVELDTPIKHLSRVSGEIGASHRVETLASKILIAAMDIDHHVGKNPKGLVAAAVYIAGIELGEPTTQDILAEATEVSSLTIRKRVKGLREAVNIKKLLESA